MQMPRCSSSQVVNVFFMLYFPFFQYIIDSYKRAENRSALSGVACFQSSLQRPARPEACRHVGLAWPAIDQFSVVYVVRTIVIMS